MPGGEQQRQEPCLQQQHIPLERQEVPAGRDQREREPPEDRQHPHRPEVQHQENGAQHPGPAHQVKRRPPCPEPEDGGDQAIPREAHLLPHRVQKGLRRENPRRSLQPLDLGPERKEGDRVDQPEGAQKEPARGVVADGPRRTGQALERGLQGSHQSTGGGRRDVDGRPRGESQLHLHRAEGQRQRILRQLVDLRGER